MMSAKSPELLFEDARPALLRVAYRMLGSMTDAEDMVQEAWVRWSKVDQTEVRQPTAFLRRTVVRLCLDALKSARATRETYVGPWLPEPVIEQEQVEDVTLPLLLALERLSPLERAAFLLHDVFGESFEEVSEALGRDVAACRQLASRARKNIREDRPRYSVPRDRGLEIAAAFFAASRRGDVEALGQLLAEDVRMYADGGGKRPAAGRILKGLSEVAKTLAGIARLLLDQPSKLQRYAFVNGLPGFVTREPDGLQTTALLIEDDRIKAIYVMRNPDKLRHIESGIQ
jgi:RNA polymerase sigma-70 factor, ECF subfamily